MIQGGENPSRRVGVLLVGHGTRDETGTSEFFDLGDRLQESLHRCIAADADAIGSSATVCPCLLEFQTPTIRQAWQALAARDVDHVVVAPLLLFAAGHAKSDIPDEVAAAHRETPVDANIQFCRPISRQSAMIDAARDRLSQLHRRTSSPGDRTAVVMVGRGSRDPCATSDMRLLSETVIRGASFDGESLATQWSLREDAVYTTFYAMAEPKLPVTLADVAATGYYDHILVQPHLLFAGRLYEAIVRQVNEADAAFDEVRFSISDYLGPSRMVADAVAARIHQTIHDQRLPGSLR
ncbi:MAG: sirohydrochlorin chelatase [Planctomycetota bacterium]